MRTTSSPSSKRAKARWAILRSALLQNASIKNKDSTEEQGKDDSEENENDMSNHHHHHHSQFSIHRFPGFQLLNYRTIPPPPPPTIVDGTSLLGPHSDNIDTKNFNTHVEGNDFEYIEYEIELPPLWSLSKTTTTTTTTPTTLQIRTRERQRQRPRQNHKRRRRREKKQKFNLHELMSHVHHGVDNTGNTRVWDSSSTLTYLLFSSSPSSATGAASSSSSSASSSSSSSTSGVIASLGSSSLLKDVVCSSVPPPIGLQQILALSRWHHTSHHDSVLDTTKRRRRTKLLKVVELGAGMAGLPSLALAALGKMAHSLTLDTATSTALATASLPKEEEEEEEEIPTIDVTITDGHPTAVQNNEACAALTSTIYEDGNSRNDSTETTTTTTTNTNTKPQMSIQSHKLLWKATNEGAEECQALLNASANNRRGHNKDSTTTTSQFDLGLVSDCIHFIEFHAALLATIGRLLRVGGICVLCQPCRGKSLQLFLEMVHAVNVNWCGTECDGGALFDLNLYDQYDDKVLQMHKEQLAHNSSQGGCYDPDIHYPVILSLKKLRDYKEEVDTEAAVDHLSTRK